MHLVNCKWLKQEKGNSNAPRAQLPELLLSCSSFQGCPGAWEHQHEPVSLETQQLFQHHLLPVHLYHTLRGCEHWGPVTHLCHHQVTHTRYQRRSDTSRVRTHRNRAQEFHHLPWTDLQISTAQTFFFHIYPTAEGRSTCSHRFSPQAYQEITPFFVVLSRRYCRVWIKYIIIFLCGFQEKIFLCYISILSQSTNTDKWNFRNLLLN